MWDRRSYLESCSGQRCTVKFEGYIPQWKDALALGVEWDDSSRGRNNGSLNGVQYFTCDVPGAGSFIKASRECEKKQKLGEVVDEFYLTLSDATLTSFGENKGAQMFGFDKSHAKQHNLNQLEVVSAIAKRVYSLECAFEFASLRQLELNDNLFDDFSNLVSQLSKFKNLKTVYLNGNRMQYDSDILVPNHTVTELSMVRTLVPGKSIYRIAEAFPNLVSLNLANNRLTEFPDLAKLPNSLKTLDLSSNFIDEIKLVSNPTQLHLDTLILSDNAVGLMEIDESVQLPSVLDLRGCAFSWDRVSLVGKDSNINSVSFMHAENALEYRLFAIARCPNISILDGTLITADERVNAEMYTLNMVARKRHPDLPENVWQSLLTKHGAPRLPMSRSIQSRLTRFYINDDPNPHSIVGDVPVYRLFMLVSRILKTAACKLTIHGVSEHLPDLFTSTVIVSDYVDDGSRLCITVN